MCGREHVRRGDPRRQGRAPSPKAASAPAPARVCFGWKGGIGTSSRVAAARYGGYTVGVLVQTNFGGVLTMGGAPVGRELGRYAFGPDVRRPGRARPTARA